MVPITTAYIACQNPEEILIMFTNIYLPFQLPPPPPHPQSGASRDYVTYHSIEFDRCSGLQRQKILINFLTTRFLTYKVYVSMGNNSCQN